MGMYIPLSRKRWSCPFSRNGPASNIDTSASARAPQQADVSGKLSPRCRSHQSSNAKTLFHEEAPYYL